MFELLFIIACIIVVIGAVGIPLAVLIGGLYRCAVHYVNDTPYYEKKPSRIGEFVYGFGDNADPAIPYIKWVLHLFFGSCIASGCVELYLHAVPLARNIIGGLVFVALLTYVLLFLMRGGVRVKTKLTQHMADLNAHKKEQ